MKGRKPKPTRLKELAGTAQPCRVKTNEMEVSRLANIPEPPFYLTDTGKNEFNIICSELSNKKMLHLVDLSLITTYCNEMALYIETETTLKTIGRIDEFYNEDGELTRRQSKPEQKIANDALNKALKIAVQFGLTPAARSRIAAPEIIENKFTL
jgi:P27 family predicted phage terminase small subunit|tara:strand:- start:5386 stop:5847 length:462 start_codon:yes stop_codon:yes gene_type:complete